LGKNKLKKFEELHQMERVFQPAFEDVFRKDHILKGKWKKKVFQNDHPLVLELGCGKGEYTVGLAKRYPENNFIGVDIKGNRIWKGAREANEDQLLNAAFLRTRIEMIDSFFEKDEVSEIWLTFPDPQLKKRRKKKRLSGVKFLTLYQKFLVNNGQIHLKTDNSVLYHFTYDLARFNNLDIQIATDDLYHSGMANDILSIKTFYEKQFLAEGLNIHYLKFSLPSGKPLKDLPEDEE